MSEKAVKGDIVDRLRGLEIGRLRDALYDATDGISGTLARDEVELLRTVAEAVYCNWACGEPIDEYMKELGKLLGFDVNIP